MRLLFFSLLLFSQLFAFFEDTRTFSASFRQSITDDHNKTIVYSGKILTKRPDMALWIYSTPVEKKIYMQKHTVIVVEPELEQAIIKKIGNNLDLFAIFSKAKSLGDEFYLANYMDMDFKIKMDGDTIESISYRDDFENSVEVIFEDQKTNIELEDNMFKADIPNDYDVIGD
jgi:outer membrane lipoprotein carrier protein